LIVDVSLLGLPGVSLDVLSKSRSDELLLLNSKEVNDLPKKNEDIRSESLDDSWGEGSSCSSAVLSEPSDEEASTDETWSEKNKGHDWLPPWDSHVSELPIGVDELICTNKED
jgi:hypothetical protein